MACPPCWALKRSCPLSCGDGCWLACPPSWAAKWLCPPLTWRWVLVGGSAFLARGLVSLDVEVGVGWCVRLVSLLHVRVGVGWCVRLSWALKRSCFPSCGGGCCLVSPPSWALKWFCPPFCGGILLDFESIHTFVLGKYTFVLGKYTFMILFRHHFSVNRWFERSCLLFERSCLLFVMQGLFVQG